MWLEICVGMMHLPPQQVWDMSIKEITLAIKGFTEYNTGKKSEPMDKSDLERLKEMYPDN